MLLSFHAFAASPFQIDSPGLTNALRSLQHSRYTDGNPNTCHSGILCRNLYSGGTVFFLRSLRYRSETAFMFRSIPVSYALMTGQNFLWKPHCTISFSSCRFYTTPPPSPTPPPPPLTTSRFSTSATPSFSVNTQRTPPPTTTLTGLEHSASMYYRIDPVVCLGVQAIYLWSAHWRLDHRSTGLPTARENSSPLFPPPRTPAP